MDKIKFIADKSHMNLSDMITCGCGCSNWEVTTTKQCELLIKCMECKKEFVVDVKKGNITFTPKWIKEELWQKVI
jgi:hypothetical protein